MTWPEVTLKFMASHEGSDYYTLIMVDPDAPSRLEASSYYLHWLVFNIKKEDLIQGYDADARSGDTLMAYTGPDPPERTGLHRYQFFIFGQPGKFEKSEIATIEGRGKFDLKNFLLQHDLGDPVAAYEIKTGRN